MSWRNARNNLATSSKCSPVVGSSNRNSEPRCGADFAGVFSGGRLLAHGVVGKVPGQFQPLGFTTRQRRNGLAQPQIVEPHIGKRRETQSYFRVGGEVFNASETVRSSTSAMLFGAKPSRVSLSSRISARNRRPSQSGQRR